MIPSTDAIGSLAALDGIDAAPPAVAVGGFGAGDSGAVPLAHAGEEDRQRELRQVAHAEV